MKLPPRGVRRWLLLTILYGVFIYINPFNYTVHLNPIAYGSWIVFIIYWNYAAWRDFGDKIPEEKDTKVQSRRSKLFQAIGTLICLPFIQVTDGINHLKILGLSWFITYYIGAILIVVGLAWAIWARRALGNQWRGHVEARSDHKLIVEGPYRITRHPIYTGMFLLAIGCVISGGASFRGLIALAVFLASYYYKMHLEEDLLVQQFKQQYIQYRKKVPKVFPGVNLF
mmetsp:Transcript_2508/g.3314  ORF Transcript_2508/g.3314 Transcript_2508/m.3314 type:complete len:227 (+) Transcript_2508:1-681(+)